MPATPYFESLLLDYSVNGTPFVISSWWLGLYSTTPTVPTIELTGSTYPRQLVTWTSSYTNASPIVFPAYTDSANTIRIIGVFDGLDSSNLLVWRPITPISLPVGGIVTVAAGALSLDVLNS